MNSATIQHTLASHLQRISTFVVELPETYWHQHPDERWTIAEELFHLTKSNGGTARLLSRPPEQLRETDRPSRTYETIVQEYREKYAAVPFRGPQGIQPDEAPAMDKATLTEQWEQASRALQRSAEAWREDRWDRYTVWKHPLLGPLTVREMLYFTTFHNEHHAEVMKQKYQKLVGT